MGKKKTFTGYTLYLLALLAVAVLYLTVFFPKQKQEMDALDAQYQTLQTQIQTLVPYEAKLSEIKQQTGEATVQFEGDKTLKAPVEFTNALCDAAAAGGVTVESITVTETGEVPIEGGFTGKAYNAQVNVGILPGTSPAKFLSAIESNVGAGFYVQDFVFEPTRRTPEQGADPFAEAAAQKAAAEAAAEKAKEKADENSVYNEMRAKAEAAAQDARIKAERAADSNNPADQVDAQIAAALASKLASELADMESRDAIVNGKTNGVPTAKDGKPVLKNTAGADVEMDIFSLNVTYYTMEK
ncbi:MAG: hypothetical protein RSD61_02415 [Ruthenibacterium sp.]